MYLTPNNLPHLEAVVVGFFDLDAKLNVLGFYSGEFGGEFGAG
jgi:hypothetical protein